jgi:squalene-hopene/tetraprenyl-beta-curcumene cyclase
MIALTLVLALSQPSPPRTVGPDRKVLAEVIEKGRAFLKKQQMDSGGFSQANPGITAIGVMALCRTGDKADPVVLKALTAIEAMIDEKDGHMAKGQKNTLLNYLTSINVQALATADAKKYAAVNQRAAKFLIALQFDEKKGKDGKDPYYGGVGYDGELRPDLSNTSMTLQAVEAAGIDRSDAFFKKSLVYVSRCQNLKGEHNDQPWAGLINDGSFLYGCGPAAERMYNYVDANAVKPNDPHPGYGSMTCAGLICFDIAKLGRDDERFKKGITWLNDEFTTDSNPGFEGPLGGCGGWAYYYYLAHLAKCLDRLGIDEITDRKNRKRDWRAEITRALSLRQRADGSWANDSTAFFEGDPAMATGWALIALSYCQPKELRK